jgi:CheY-like chemotaxis protein
MKSVANEQTKSKSNKLTALVLENDSRLRKVVSIMLEQYGISVVEAPTTTIAQEIIQTHTPDLLVIDFQAPSSDSGELIKMFRDKCKSYRKAVLITTFIRPDDNWRKLYAPDVVIYKPYDLRYLINCI